MKRKRRGKGKKEENLPMRKLNKDRGKKWLF